MSEPTPHLRRSDSALEFDPNRANEKERDAIKLARSMDDAALRRVMGSVMATYTPSQLRAHGAATFVLARRKEA